MKMEIIFAFDHQRGSLRTADAFPVVASLPPKRERSDDRKCVCGSQATNVAAVTSLANHQFLTSDDFVEKTMENDAAITTSAGTHIEAQHVVEFLTI